MNYEDECFVNGSDPIKFGHHRAIFRVHSTEISTVYLVNDETDSKDKILKLIPIKNNQSKIQNEISIMKYLEKCPYTLHIHSSFVHKNYQCIITPYARYGSLCDILQMERYCNGINENAVRSIMTQVLLALKYMHSIDICHRDIKPENIFVLEWNGLNPKVVLGDFGSSTFILQGEKCAETVGTETYAAPEIYAGNPHDRSVDIWELGVTMHVPLFNQFPFPDSQEWPKLFKMTMEKKKLSTYHFIKNGYGDARDLFMQMCNYDPEKRIAVEEALKHSWFAN